MKAKWTVMIYMAGDNNLDSAATTFQLFGWVHPVSSH